MKDNGAVNNQAASSRAQMRWRFAWWFYIFGLPHRPDPAANGHVHQWDRDSSPRLFFTVKGLVPKVSLMCNQGIEEDFMAARSVHSRFATKLGGLGRILSQSMLIITIALAGTPMVYAQAGSSTLVGQVKDASGASVAGAKITVTNVGTGEFRTTETNLAGEYSVPFLAIGEYKVTADLSGFSSYTEQGIYLAYERTVRVNITLQVGDVRQTVTVISSAPLLSTEDAATSTVVSRREVNDLPLNGRNFIQLTHLIPGTTPGSPGNRNTAYTDTGFQVSAYGQRDFNNNYTLDGVGMTETRNPSPAFLPSVDAIQEFTVHTGLYSAQYGLRAGAQVDVALKAGTNQFHGDVYEFERNKVFDSRNFFSPRIEPLNRNQFGGTVGGPIRKERTFFFVAYDGTRQATSYVGTTVVPTPQKLSGDFSASATPIINPSTGEPFPGNIIPTADIDPDAAIIAKYFPQPNQPGSVSNYVRLVPQFNNVDQGFVRIDQKLTEKDSLFGHYAISHKRAILYPSTIDSFGDLDSFHAQNFTLQETHSFNPTRINQLVLGYSRYLRDESAQQRYPGVAQQLNIAGVDPNPALIGFPAISIQGYAGIGEDSQAPTLLINETKELRDTLTTIHGKHSIKVGTDIMRIRNQQGFPISPRGSFSFTGYLTGDPVADFLLGRAQQTSGSVGLNAARAFTTLYHFFGTDDWQVSPNLTLNIGLRYELDPPVQDQRGLARNFNPVTGQLFPSSIIRMRLYNFDKGDLAPRFSFAYRPFGGTKTVVRGGYGIFYSLPEFNNFTNLSMNPPFFTYNTFGATPETPLTIENPFPISTIVPAGAAAPYGVDQNGYRNPRTQLWSLLVGRNLTPNLMLEVGYTGSRTDGLLVNSWINQPTPGPGANALRRPYPQWGDISYFTPMGFSTYHGLTVKVEKRYSLGLLFLASYSYSKALDIMDSSVFGDRLSPNSQNGRDIAAEYGRASFDLRHYFSFAYVYELPFGRGKSLFSTIGPVTNAVVGGWKINGVTTVTSGPPFTLRVGGDPAGIGGSGTLRPDRVCNGNLPGSQRSIEQWFDTSCFVAPPPYTFGSSGRNVLTAPGMVNFDFSLFKQFSIRDRARVEFRAEFFNVLNHANFSYPGQVLNTPTYGEITSTATSARQGQLALKLYF